jgi:transcriptional regulator with XRE-family HTH domain
MAHTATHQAKLHRESSGKHQKAKFAERLRATMQNQGLTIAETARRVRQHLPSGEGFDDTNLIHYRQARSVPRPVHLEALSRALGVSASDLLGTETVARLVDTRQRTATSRVPLAPRQPGIAEAGRPSPVIQVMEDYGENVLLRFEQLVPWPVALRILQLLKDPQAADFAKP